MFFKKITLRLLI